MNVQATKLQFIEQYLKITDKCIIDKLYQTLTEEIANKKRLSLSEEENDAINRGLEDIKNTRILSGEQVRDKIKMKYPNLIK